MADILNFNKGGNNQSGGSYTVLPPDTEKLPQDDYLFEVVNKVTGEQNTFIKRGHLVLTNTNVVLMDEKSEIKWAIRNDEDLISFERLDMTETDLMITVPADQASEVESET